MTTKVTVDTNWRARSWSFSAISDYQECPLRYALSKFAKLEQPKGPALANGIALHEAMESFLGGPPDIPVPNSLAEFSAELHNIKKLNPTIEEPICLDRFWRPVKGDDPWSNPETWLRGRLDVRVKSFVVDLKSGRSYPKYREQCELYATMMYASELPDLGDEITTELWYTKSGRVETHAFSRADHKSRLKKWDDAANRLMSEAAWKPKLNDACRFCHVQEHCEIISQRKRR